MGVVAGSIFLMTITLYIPIVFTNWWHAYSLLLDFLSSNFKLPASTIIYSTNVELTAFPHDKVLFHSLYVIDYLKTCSDMYYFS